MKLKILFVAFAAFLLLTTSCDDDLNSLGLNVKPSEDEILVKADTTELEASTFKVDAISAKSITGLLGNFSDPVFGNLKSDFMSQFYCPEGLAFPDSVINSKIDSVDVVLFYNSITGDSLAPMQVSIYKAIKGLDKNFYSDIDATSYCDMSKPLGTQAYTASNIGMRDSVITSSSGSSVSYKYLRIRLPLSLGQDLYEKSKTEGIFDTREDFNKYFPGLYITTTYGEGSLIEVISTSLNFYFNYQATTYNGEDSLYNTTGILSMYTTKEVLQLNRFNNANIDELVQENETTAFIKTPAGVFTEIEIPLKEMQNKIYLGQSSDGYTVNSVELNIKAYATPLDTEYPLKAPDNVLVIPADEYADFFDSFTMPDNITSFINTYIASYDTTNLVYKFKNLTPLLKKLQENNASQEKVKAYLIPVTVNSDSNGNVTSISHYLKPTAVRIMKRKEDMNFAIIFSKF